MECGHYYSHGNDSCIPSAEYKVQFDERYCNQNVTGTGLCAFCDEPYVLLTILINRGRFAFLNVCNILNVFNRVFYLFIHIFEQRILTYYNYVAVLYSVAGIYIS